MHAVIQLAQRAMSSAALFQTLLLLLLRRRQWPPDFDRHGPQAAKPRFDNSVGVLDFHTSSSLRAVEQSVVLLLGVVALVGRHREYLLLETKIHEYEFFIFFLKCPRLSRKC